MNIVVTGATGFLGSAVTRALVARGDRVQRGGPRSVRSLAPGRHGRDLDDRRHHPTRQACVISLGEPTRLSMRPAGSVSSACRREPMLPIARRGHTRPLRRPGRAAHAAAPALHQQSRCVGSNQRFSSCRGTAPLAPSNVYERSKAASRKRSLTSLLAQGLPVVVARPEFIYGPGDTHVFGLFRPVHKGRFFYIGDGSNYLPSDLYRRCRAWDHRARSIMAGKVRFTTSPAHSPSPSANWRRPSAAALDVPPPRFALARSAGHARRSRA